MQCIGTGAKMLKLTTFVTALLATWSLCQAHVMEYYPNTALPEEHVASTYNKSSSCKYRTVNPVKYACREKGGGV